MDLSRQANLFLEQEARALKTRLNRVKSFALFESTVPAAAPGQEAFLGIERFVAHTRAELGSDLDGFSGWLGSAEGRAAPPEAAQARLCFLRIRFNTLLSQFDMFADALTQRSEPDTGVWLAGLDEAASDALCLEDGSYVPPPVLCYLDRGHGAAIRRARTRLPGGGSNPVAVIRVPRERMVGSGIAASLVHEVGHQGCALLGLVESLRPVLQGMQSKGGEARVAWDLWDRWISEILADYWAVARLGIAATLGLFAVVSLPSSIVFRVSESDPHPSPWIRLLLSAALGGVLYPHPQWESMRRLWIALYPPAKLGSDRRRIFEQLLATMPAFAALVVNHRPRSLRGRSLAEAMNTTERRPARLAHHYRAWRGPRWKNVRPTMAFAVLGQARWNGWLSPEAESRMVASLLQHWALRRALSSGVSCARPGNPISMRRLS